MNGKFFDDSKATLNKISHLTQIDITRIVNAAPRDTFITNHTDILGSADEPGFKRIRPIRLAALKLQASLFEEIGELSTALKQEQGVVQHKKLQENAASEAVDVYICGMMMYVALGGDVSKLSLTSTFNEEEAIKAKQAQRANEKADIFFDLANLFNFAGKLNDYLIGFTTFHYKSSEEVLNILVQEKRFRDELGHHENVTLPDTKELISNTRPGQNLALDVANSAFEMYLACNGNPNEFANIASLKLAKWERTVK